MGRKGKLGFCLRQSLSWAYPADVHTVLADLATEQESFEDALSDYKQAQQLLAPKLKVILVCQSREY